MTSIITSTINILARLTRGDRQDVPHSTNMAVHAKTPAETGNEARFAMLDGWRALSILLVLAGHLLPLGPRILGLNAPVAATGMVLFFILSGFLITRSLSANANLRSFVIRRFFRIVPLAWLVMLILLISARAQPEIWAANLLFYANLPPQRLVEGGGHLWSLCVEMQLYVGLAMFVALFTRRGFVCLPIIALAVTIARVRGHHYLDIVTWFRGDEILAGGILALIYNGSYGEAIKRVFAWINPLWLLPILLASAHPEFGALQYFRPYIAMTMVGASLYGVPAMLARVSEHRLTGYIATISYALYIIHGALGVTWLASGDSIVKYAKRPLFFAVTFGLAHVSTFRLEQPCIAYAKRLTRGIMIKTPA